MNISKEHVRYYSLARQALVEALFLGICRYMSAHLFIFLCWPPYKQLLDNVVVEFQIISLLNALPDSYSAIQSAVIFI